jgi:hypothetical protein
VISLPEYNTLFVGLSKVGSTSIRSACAELGIFRYVDQHVPVYISHKHLQHLNAHEYKKMLGEKEFEKRFKFTIVKNPWALLVSKYLAECRKPGGYPERKGAYEPEKFHRWITGGYPNGPFDKEFHDNLLCPAFDNTKARTYHGRPGNQIAGARCLHHRYTYDSQQSWFTDESGNLMVDYIMRFETINEDFRTVLNKINDIHPLPKEKNGNWDLPWKNSASRGKHWTWYYDDETVEIVRKHYKKDIEEFGYEFRYEF